MVQLLKSASFTALALAAGFAGMTATPRTVHAEDGCLPVHGLYHADVTTTGCTSPIGLCATGTITRGWFLDSASVFVALDVAPSAGMPTAEPAANASYSGTITIDAHDGTLTLRDLGVIDSIHGNFSEIERPTSGTGLFANATHDFFISGSLSNNQNTFDGQISGELCGLALPTFGGWGFP
jgi:hypothetical protein